MLKAILFTTIKNSICQKILKSGAIYQFCIFFKLRCLAKQGLAENGRNTKIAKLSLFFWFLNLHNFLERVYPYKFQNTLNYFLMHQKKKKKCLKWKILYFLKNWHPRSLCMTIWKFWKPNSTSVLMPCLHKKLSKVGKWTVLGQSNLNSSSGKICKK